MTAYQRSGLAKLPDGFFYKYERLRMLEQIGPKESMRFYFFVDRATWARLLPLRKAPRIHYRGNVYEVKMSRSVTEGELIITRIV